MSLATVTPLRPLPKHADHSTPLVRDAWYVAGLSDEISRALLPRTLLGTRVVLYRKQDGSIVALHDRCRHRSFPLSKGKLEGDRVVCGYHGMVYNAEGRCEHVPALPNTPGNIRVDSYPVVEKAPLVWIWMGDRAKADPAAIPDTSWLADPDWATVGDCFPIKTNYVAMHENLLDQTHFSFLHAGAVGTPEWATAPMEVTERDDGVYLRRELKNSPAPGIYAEPMKLGDRPVDRLSEAGYVGPGLHVAHATIAVPEPADGERAAFRVNIAHVITPETQNTIHYWWFNSRDFALDDADVGALFPAASSSAYMEEVEALAWISDIVESEPPGYREMSFRSDRPGLLMRQSLQRRADAEMEKSRA